MSDTLARAGLNADLCRRLAATHAHPRVFSTVSGAHLYGFPSHDSDYDLRGAHVLPVHDLIGLGDPAETVQSEGIVEGVEIDLVTHDIAKFIRMMLKRNGYVLEQLLSPLVVETSPWHEELCALAPCCITRHHAHHYLGFAQTQWGLFHKDQAPRVKPLLYLYRVLLTGIHLMRTGEVIANLQQLNDEYRLPYVPDLIARKVGGPERSTLSSADSTFHESEYLRLVRRLEKERDASSLPEEPTARTALNSLLLRIRWTNIEPLRN